VNELCYCGQPAGITHSHTQAIGVFNAPAIGMEPCPGCGTAYLTGAVNPFRPHNPAECVAYRRGFEAGVAYAKTQP
jgi:hypothetical protein